MPASAGIGLAYWNLRVSHRFVWQRFGVRLCLSSCLNYPRFHGGKLCTGWGLPSSALRSDWSRQTKPNARPFVAEYAALWGEAGSNGGKIFFAGESHFRADAELRGKWVLKGMHTFVVLPKRWVVERSFACGKVPPTLEELRKLDTSLQMVVLAFAALILQVLRSDWSRQTKPNARPFVAEYAALWGEAGSNGGKIFFAGEWADAELRGKWVLKGEPALVDSSSPMHGEKASYYSAVCLETGEVEWMELEGNSNGESSVAFLERLRERHSGRLNVIWDNAPAHRGPAMRSYLEAPGLNLRLVTPHF